jgi:hypothetical protein
VLLEVLMYQWAVVQLEAGDTGCGQVGQLIGITSAVEEMPHIYQEARVRCIGAAQQVDRDPRVGECRPRKRLEGDQ